MLGVENSGKTNTETDLESKIKNFAEEVNKSDGEETIEDSTNGIGKKLALAGIIISMAALGYIIFSGGSDTLKPNSQIPSRDNTTSIIKDTYEGMDLQDRESISDFTRTIIDNTETPNNAELSVPKITNENGDTFTSNGVIRIEETRKVTPAVDQAGTEFQRSLIEERRDAGMEIDQRLNDAKVNDVFVISKGRPGIFTGGTDYDVAPSTGRVLIIGGQVNTPDRVVDSDPMDVEGVSPEYNMYSGGTGGYAEDALKNTQNALKQFYPKEIVKAFMTPKINKESIGNILTKPDTEANSN